MFTARLKRKVLNQKDMENIRDSTPPLSQGSPRLFRNLRDKGSIYIYTSITTIFRYLSKYYSFILNVIVNSICKN